MASSIAAAAAGPGAAAAAALCFKAAATMFLYFLRSLGGSVDLVLRVFCAATTPPPRSLNPFPIDEGVCAKLRVDGADRKGAAVKDVLRLEGAGPLLPQPTQQPS